MSPAPDAAPGSLKAAWLVAGKDPSLVADALAGLLPELLGKADRSLVLEDFSGTSWIWHRLWTCAGHRRSWRTAA